MNRETPLHNLPLPTRARNVIVNILHDHKVDRGEGSFTLGHILELVEAGKIDFRRQRNIGAKTYKQLEKFFAEALSLDLSNEQLTWRLEERHLKDQIKDLQSQVAKAHQKNKQIMDQAFDYIRKNQYETTKFVGDLLFDLEDLVGMVSEEHQYDLDQLKLFKKMQTPAFRSGGGFDSLEDLCRQHHYVLGRIESKIQLAMLKAEGRLTAEEKKSRRTIQHRIATKEEQSGGTNSRGEGV